MEKKIEELEGKVDCVILSLEVLKKHTEEINIKLEKLCKVVDEHVVPDCDKMSNHINFIETVYNTVKNPLGFLCNRINRVIGMIGNGGGNIYSLTDNGHTSFSQAPREISIK